MKDDIPILGQPKSSNSLLTASLFHEEIKRIDANARAWMDRMKINELRKSCGIVEKTAYTINVRRPARYLSK